MATAGRGRGFTLIELLVVMLLIGVLTSFALLSMPSTTTTDVQREEARRLLARMELAHDEAILQARPVGLISGRDGYRFVWLAEDGWQDFGAGHPLRAHELPEAVRLELRVEGLEIEPGGAAADDDDRRGPQLHFLPGGEVLPEYDLLLHGNDSSVEFRIAPGDEQWFELHERRF